MTGGSPKRPAARFCLLLHAHLPFVRHPEDPDPLEERWFHEAMAETYLPLLGMLRSWERDGVDWRLALVLTPTLSAMMTDQLLLDRFRRNLAKRIELAEREVERRSGDRLAHATALGHRRRWLAARKIFDGLDEGGLPRAFAALAASGRLELAGCAATHGFLPLLAVNGPAVRAQIETGVQSHVRTFGRRPETFWLPECGYSPELDPILAAQGVRFSALDSHGVLHADPPPPTGVFAPVRTAAGPAFMGRDGELSRLVWSAGGYPGDGRYLEFHRDAGFDLDMDYVRPYIHASGLRVATGARYHRITGPDVELGRKAPYDPAEAERALDEHAADFAGRIADRAARLAVLTAEPPAILLPFDAELFGHWWAEGLGFLDRLARRLASPESSVRLATPAEILQDRPRLWLTRPAASSWGRRGHSEMWLDGANDWIYPHLHAAADRLAIQAAVHAGTRDEALRAALNQSARELLLAQSSDWAFMMKTGPSAEYARRRTREHLLAADDFRRMIDAGRIDEALTAERAEQWNLFPELQFEAWAAG